MLRRLKIGGRVNVLIAVPLVALLTLAALGYVALQRASVRGAEYKSLKLAQDLRADTLPPPASLLQAWAEVNHIGVVVASEGFTADNEVIIAGHLQAIAAARAEFDQAMARWAAVGLPQRVELRLVQVGSEMGRNFFAAVDTQLRPALDAHDAAEVMAAIRSLEWRYDVQQTGVTRALTWAQAQVTAREKSTADYVGTVVRVGAIAAGALILATLLLSVRVRRSIVRPIRALAARAKQVANVDLPRAVDAVQDLAPGAEVPHIAPFVVNNNDELGELSASIGSMQDAAVDLAAGQAAARRIVSENLVNIARRNQSLLGRTLGFISSLEQGERDPEALENLFRLDHLTTRMRRNAQSLLVLAGAEPTRRWAPAVPIGDVVRAALSEVENYTQIDLADLGDVAVQGSVANEVSHLLAELLENATSFSPPSTPVTVVGRAVPDGHQLAIFDYGLGMTKAELDESNRRLNEVSGFDQRSSKVLGLQVVARLAARLRINVMLTSTPGGTGVTAVVRLPASILEELGADVDAIDTIVGAADAADRLSVPLPVADVADDDDEQLPRPTEMTDDALWASMHAASGTTLASAPAAPAETVAETVTGASGPVLAGLPLVDTASGLAKRVRGAQMPDLGAASMEAPLARPAGEVRDSLASLQRGVQLGRERSGE